MMTTLDELEVAIERLEAIVEETGLLVLTFQRLLRTLRAEESQDAGQT